MPRYGLWKPLASNWDSQARLSFPDLIIVHTMAGSLAGTDAYFRQNGYGGVESHFGMGADGTVWQWQDTSRIAEANYRGNHRIISIETADKGTGFDPWSGSDVPAWTDHQLASLARLIAFLCKEHSIPCTPIPDSKPGRRGVGHHRLGIDPWRVSGGELWSTARGKACPGAHRIAQLPRVIVTAQALMDGSAPAPPSGTYARLGDRNDRVKNLQTFMTTMFRSYNLYRPTGYYGEATRAGVEEFQKRVGITGPDADGSIVGPRTLAKLQEYGFTP